MMQALTLGSDPHSMMPPFGLNFAYLTRLRRLTLLDEADSGLQARALQVHVSCSTCTWWYSWSPCHGINGPRGPACNSGQDKTLLGLGFLGRLKHQSQSPSTQLHTTRLRTFGMRTACVTAVTPGSNAGQYEVMLD